MGALRAFHLFLSLVSNFFLIILLCLAENFKKKQNKIICMLLGGAIFTLGGLVSIMWLIRDTYEKWSTAIWIMTIFFFLGMQVSILFMLKDEKKLFNKKFQLETSEIRKVIFFSLIGLLLVISLVSLSLLLVSIICGLSERIVIINFTNLILSTSLAIIFFLCLIQHVNVGRKFIMMVAYMNLIGGITMKPVFIRYMRGYRVLDIFSVVLFGLMSIYSSFTSYKWLKSHQVD